MPHTMDDIVSHLSERGIRAEAIGPTLNLQRGEGPQASRANIDPSAFLKPLNRLAPHLSAPQLAQYVAGVAAVLAEPGRSRASTWTFERSAGRLLPRVVGPGFVSGARDASGGDSPVTLPFAHELELVFTVDLDRGQRLLTTSQTEVWGVDDERIWSAARSMLYHRSSRVTRRELGDGVWQLGDDDDYAASRIFIFEDLFFGEVDAQFRFAIPTPGHLSFVVNARSTPALEAHARACYSEMSTPLSTGIFRLDRGRPVPTES